MPRSRCCSNSYKEDDVSSIDDSAGSSCNRNHNCNTNHNHNHNTCYKKERENHCSNYCNKSKSCKYQCHKEKPKKNKCQDKKVIIITIT